MKKRLVGEFSDCGARPRIEPWDPKAARKVRFAPLAGTGRQYLVLRFPPVSSTALLGDPGIGFLRRPVISPLAL